jgi:hypothetical protein
MSQRMLDTRIDRVEGRRGSAASKKEADAIRRRRLWRAEVAIGAVIREALARNGVDPAGVARLALADEAAAALAEIPDTPELRSTDQTATPPLKAQERVGAGGFAAKIAAMTRAAAEAPPPDLKNASFAELFAWSLVAVKDGN